MLNARLCYGLCISEEDNVFIESLAAQPLQKPGSAANDLYTCKPRRSNIYVIPTQARPTGMVLRKEMRPKGHVATSEASIHYVYLALLYISVSWMMLLDKHCSFIIV